jgi:hypothetical protein
MGRSSSEQASQKKKLGHAEESTFNLIFGNKKVRDINFSGASEDNEITNTKYKLIIEKELGKLKYFTVSLKSGVTWQFHLGRIDELSDLSKIKIRKTKSNETKIIHNISFEAQVEVLRNVSFWNKYLKKGEILCYINQNKKYTFFKMNDVITFLRKEVEWRLLPTGRIKGDILQNNKKYSLLTFEYRETHKSFAFGAMGSQSGLKLFEILVKSIKFCEIDLSSNLKIIDNTRSKNIPNNPNDDGKIGQISFDENYLYICIANKKWKRIEFSSWQKKR